MIKMKELKDVMALPPTPLTAGGKIDVESLRSVIDFLMDNGCYGVGVLAAIGEGYLMSSKDWKTVVKTAVDHMNGKGPLLVGCASMGTGRAVELIKEAEDFGADAILAFNPQGMRNYTENELFEHFKALTEATDIHIVPYARASDPIPFEVIKRLVDEERIKYMKYAFRSCSLLQKMEKSIGEKLFKFCGADTWTLRYLLLGCKGIMTATASVFPKENVELLSLVKNGKIEEARKHWYEKLLTWNDSGFYENWQWAHKYALKLMKIIQSDYVAPPQSIGADYHKEELEALLKYQGKI
jgi:dihydrodipicolinate synthase/N-acetylneuraminate lyase